MPVGQREPEVVGQRPCRARGQFGGIAAGWSNAASRTRNPINIAAAQENILHPGYQDKLAQWQSRVMGPQAKLDLALQQMKAQEAQEQIAAQAEERMAHAQQRENLASPHYGQMEVDPANYPGVKPGPDGKLWVAKSVEEERMKEANKTQGFAPGAQIVQGGRVISNGGPKPVTNATEMFIRDNPNATAADVMEFERTNKAEPASAAKLAFQATVAKIADQLPGRAMTDVGVLSSAIRSSAALTPQEKRNAIGYLTANPSPATAGTTATIRMEGLGNTREYPVINTRNKQMEMRSASEINANPGLYAPAAQGATTMGKEAVFQDLHYNINTARNAIAALPSMDAGTRAALSFALRHTDPASAIQTFLAGQVGQALSPEQQEAVQSLALLSENALALRGVAGMGQGSDDLRAAIQGH